MTEESNVASPLVQWSTIRIFLVLTLTLGWPTICCDYSNAFLQSKQERDVYMLLPRGFKSHLPGKTCLKLLRSLYGQRSSPMLWAETLFKAHRKLGLKQSENDKCLWFGDGLVVIVYCDDCGIGARTKEIADKFIEGMKQLGFKLTTESTFSEYLGIKIDRNDKEGTITMTQPGLIKKILETTEMQECAPQWTPAKREALGKDPDGEPMKEKWTAPQVNGMLLYLATNTRIDIAAAVSATCRFNHHTKQSHAIAIK